MLDATMNMRQRILILVVLAIPVAGLVTILTTRKATPAPGDAALSISFQGYSNNPSGQRYALFAVTNHDTCDLILWNGGAVEFEDPNTPSNIEVYYSLVGSNLHRGVPYTMFTETPPSHGRWRLHWMVMRRSLTQKLVEFSTSVPLIPNVNNGTPDFFYDSSDWVPE